MAKARAIGKRRKAVQNIRKITRTMQLIATARFQSAYSRAMATKPYVENITRLVEELSRAGGDIQHPLLTVNQGTGRTILIVLTSNRGLCGGYNSAMLRTAMEHIRGQEAAGRSVELNVVGKKGIAYFKFLNRPMVWTDTGFEGTPAFAQVDKIAGALMDAYTGRRVDAVHVAYTRFLSAGAQRPEVLQLLPIRRPGAAEAAAERSPLLAGETGVQYEFSPPAEQLLAELLPEFVKVRLFQCFNDAAVSEQTARMVAMKAATDAAGDMIRSLTQRLNRARQSQITLELLDIVAGAEALA
ncbi:MAG: ATP synthase F1 subunit gamma [Planctomycetes bacterium]|nr:ATP synthase F1 subunit gamma [Planctomycetota bacterium]